MSFRPLEFEVFPKVNKGVLELGFWPNYVEAWISAIEYVTRTNSTESSDRTLPIKISFFSQYARSYSKTHYHRRKRRILMDLIKSHNRRLCNLEKQTLPGLL